MRRAFGFLPVLDRRGALALVTVELGATPYMRQVAHAVHEAAQRRPRRTTTAVRQLAALSRVPLRAPRAFEDETELDAEGLERVLRSISFVGPGPRGEPLERSKRRY